MPYTKKCITFSQHLQSNANTTECIYTSANMCFSFSLSAKCYLQFDCWETSDAEVGCKICKACTVHFAHFNWRVTQFMSYFPVYRFKLLTVATPWCIKLNKKHSFEVQYI